MKKSTFALTALFVIAFAVIGLLAYQVISNSDNTPSPIHIVPPQIDADDPVLGPEDAAVTIIEFADFQCSFCRSMRNTLVEVISQYQGQVRLVWKDLADTNLHPESVAAAQAARCAQEQDMFWEFHDYLYANQDILSDELYAEIAEALNLDTAAFSSCLVGPLSPSISSGYQEAIEKGVTATPHFFVNSVQKSGTISAEELQRIIEQELHG